jgi:hypothetical protein
MYQPELQLSDTHDGNTGTDRLRAGKGAAIPPDEDMQLAVKSLLCIKGSTVLTVFEIARAATVPSVDRRDKSTPDDMRTYCCAVGKSTRISMSAAWRNACM